MPRISTYSVDTTVQKTDKLLGSNADGATRNFTIDGVREYFNQDSSAGASDELNYLYKPSTSNTEGHMSTNTGSTPQFSAISTIKLHEKANGLTSSVANFFSEFTNKDIVIIDSTDLNKYGVYTVTAVTADSGNSGLYDLTLVYKSGNGSFVNDNFYSILLYSGAQDKDYKHLQSSAATTWNVAHNLNKFPSVTVTLADGTQVQADVQHTNKNNLTITFSGDNSGIAYMN